MMAKETIDKQNLLIIELYKRIHQLEELVTTKLDLKHQVEMVKEVIKPRRQNLESVTKIVEIDILHAVPNNTETLKMTKLDLEQQANAAIVWQRLYKETMAIVEEHLGPKARAID